MSPLPIRIGLIGFGKIARDQHMPALANDHAFRLVGAVDRRGPSDGIRTYVTIESLIQAEPGLQAVAICTPATERYALARTALDAGLHVMLEKPPGATVVEVSDLASRAQSAGLTLFTTWHSREAAGVAQARRWLAERTVRSVRATWHEDVRVWHPGQDWLLAPGGFGVFDPGINALSILTHVLPQPLTLRQATLRFPSNRAAPIAAELDLSHGLCAPVIASFDIQHTGLPRWDIEIETDDGTLLLSEGGRRLSIDGAEQVTATRGEYAGLYARFAHLISCAASDVDLVPLQHVADAFMRGRRIEAPAFEF